LRDYVEIVTSPVDERGLLTRPLVGTVLRTLT